jgi:hypothetical protein
MPHSFTTFKGQLILVLKANETDERGFQFGRTKALAMAAAMPRIIGFAETGTIQAGPVEGYIVQRDTYKRNPMIVIMRDYSDRWPVQFQQPKARLVAANAELVKAFSKGEVQETIGIDLTDYEASTFPKGAVIGLAGTASRLDG